MKCPKCEEEKRLNIEMETEFSILPEYDVDTPRLLKSDPKPFWVCPRCNYEEERIDEEDDLS